MKRASMDLPEIPPEREDDLHNMEHMNNADLVLFMAGNQFMVMGELLDAFRSHHPDVKSVFYETLPPGLELRQILAGGARFRDTVIDCMPDIYSSVTEEAMQELRAHDLIDKHFIYLHNRIVVMVHEGNPLSIKTVNDLGRDDIRVSQPGEMEDISKYITAMYDQVGGSELVRRILEEKDANGTTVFTTVHHRETPLRIKKNMADAGPVWATEVINARKEGLAVESIEPGEELDQSDSVNYYIAKINEGGNPENADRFLAFIKSRQAQELYRSFGFVPHFYCK